MLKKKLMKKFELTPKTINQTYITKACIQHVVLRHKFYPHRIVAVSLSQKFVPKIQ